LLGHLEHLFNYYTSIIAKWEFLVNQKKVVLEYYFLINCVL